MTWLFIGLGVAGATAIGSGIYLFVKNRNDPFNRMSRIFNKVQNMGTQATRKARRLAKKTQRQAAKMQKRTKKLQKGVQQTSESLGSMTRDLEAFQGELYGTIDAFLGVSSAIDNTRKNSR